MALVGSLSAHTQGRADVAPRPALRAGTLHGLAFALIGELAERGRSTERGGVVASTRCTVEALCLLFEFHATHQRRLTNVGCGLPIVNGR